ncbi:putative bifunctional diguanylate cyclase/phosphodiesterase [Paractinoplanes rishiriensis]|uniref:Diguanylate cyclase/phosphodiesterase n=1 Tax=Paractinoplanes rishiriensis TaxID=1050105 RepID=A0A919K4F6_9ACTN|nr:EAL domain-containing protein [Actinoplanes rishiriensis]GIE98388.1 hypothetical protein Ari01nite_58530 [Actinoplanes rishiriensis]
MGALRTRLSALTGGPDVLLRHAGVLMVVAIALFTVNAVDPVLPWWLLWAPAVIGSGVVTVHFWRTAQAEHLPAPIRRFWRHVCVVAILVGCGILAEAIQFVSIDMPTRPAPTPVQLVFHAAAVVLVVYAMFRLPFGGQTRGGVFRVVLDAGTVMLGCAVFMWHFSTRNAFATGDSKIVWSSLVLSLLAMVAVFAVAKVTLTRHESALDRTALRLVGLAVLIGALVPVMFPLVVQSDPRLHMDIIDLPIIYFIVGLASRRQRAAEYGPRRGKRPARMRSFSVLPYVAVAAVDGLLLAVTIPEPAPGYQLVVVSAILLTAVVVIRQVTAFLDNGRLLKRLDHGATHDALTQLPNRVLFHDRLQQALAAPGDRRVSVALIDLDDFKIVNDTLGHEVGDQLLVSVAERLGACIRVEDTVARLGGDEFVVVLDGVDPAAADLAAQRMIAALAAPVLADGHELPIRASIGVADGRAGDDPSVLLRQADIAMYAAKLIPGTAHLHYTADMTQPGTDQTGLGADLSQALERDELFLIYQPIVALEDGRLLGAEALVRWAHPTHGTLSPQVFVPAAERNGLIVPLTRWVLRAALTQLATWDAGALPGLSVNVSARDLREPDLIETVAALLTEFDIQPGRVTLEITESVPLDVAEAAATVRGLRALGVRVALDDFGTGSSTLTTLHGVPVDELKLDLSFTQTAPTAEVPVAAAVRQMAGSLGLHAVAEGVETQLQADHLRELGYVAAQGFHFARPMPAADFTAFLTGVPLTSAA